MLINGAKPSCAYHFSNERGMKFCQNRQILWKKIWNIEIIPGMLWRLHQWKNIRFKDIVSYKSFDPIWNPFHYYPWEKIRSTSWAHSDLLMSTLWVHSDQNADPWPSREFTKIKMLTVTICFLLGFPHRSGSTCILFCSIRNWLWPFASKSICHKYKVTRIDHINRKCSWFSAQLLHNLC